MTCLHARLVSGGTEGECELRIRPATIYSRLYVSIGQLNNKELSKLYIALYRGAKQLSF